MPTDNRARRIAELTIGGPFVVFHVEIANAVGGLHEGIFLEYIYRWQLQAEDGWAYRTEDEIQKDTTLNRYQQRNARATLKNLAILHEKRQGVPARVYYRIDEAAMEDHLYLTSSATVVSPVRPPSPDWSGHGGRTIKGITGEEQNKDIKALHTVRRKTQITADWQPDTHEHDFAYNRGMTLAQINEEIEKFRDYHRSKGNTFVDIGLAWKNWCRNWHPPRVNGTPPQEERPYDWRVPNYDLPNDYTGMIRVEDSDADVD